MFEKVNPSHPDKVADRIAGAIVDLAYRDEAYPRVAVEVLLGHGVCHIIAETSVNLDVGEVGRIVDRIAGDMMMDFRQVPQDAHLARNQAGSVRCGDNGIFRGMPVTNEQCRLSDMMRDLYIDYPYDGKAVLDGGRLTLCQSNADSKMLGRLLADSFDKVVVNPLGDWTGGSDCDCGCTNRKLGSDMGDAVTGGGLHGKDLSKADVSVNVYAHLKAQETGEPVELSCSIGDDFIDGKPYALIVEAARNYIATFGGFERFAEWGLI